MPSPIIQLNAQYLLSQLDSCLRLPKTRNTKVSDGEVSLQNVDV